MYLSTSFRGAMYTQYIFFENHALKYIFLRSYVPKYILPRAMHVFIISPASHTSMQFTWDKNFSHIFSNLFHAYNEFPIINWSIHWQSNQIWVYNSVSYSIQTFWQPWVHPHIVRPLQVGVLIPYLRMLSKTWTFTYHMSSRHYLRLVIQSWLATWTLDIKQCKTSISIVSMIQNHHRGSQSPIINRKSCNIEFRNLFCHDFSLMMSIVRPWQVHASNSLSTT